MVYIQHVIYGGLLDKPRPRYAASRPRTDWSYAYKIPGAVLIAPVVLVGSAAVYTANRARSASHYVSENATARKAEYLAKKKHSKSSKQLENANQPDELHCYPHTLDSKKGEIRLLVIEPAMTPSMRVVATMQSEWLFSQPGPQFEAISYCWDEVENEEQRHLARLELNKKLVRFPQSAVDALANLRHSRKERALWIDAICINQDNGAEKQEQIAMMAQIYGRASQVLIWLGKGSLDARLASYQMSTLLKQATEETQNGRTFATTVSSREGSAKTSHTGLPPNTYTGALRKFYNQRWFTRLWVVQEVALASKDVFRYGQVEFDTLKVLRTAAWLRFKIASPPRGIVNAALLWPYVDPLATVSMEPFQRRRKIKAADEKYQRLVKPVDLLTQRLNHARVDIDITSLLQASRHFDVSEPHDRFFALMGLAQGPREGEEGSTWLEVNYSRPFAEVCRDAARAAIYTSKSLDVLGLP